MLECVRRRGEGAGLYSCAVLSDSTNLDALIGFDEWQLLVRIKTIILSVTGNNQGHDSPVITVNVLMPQNYCIQQKHSHLSTSRRTAPHVRPRRAHAPTGRTTPRHGHSHGLGLGEENEHARSCGLSISSYRLLKGCTQGPLFKSVKILLKYQYGIKHLIP